MKRFLTAALLLALATPLYAQGLAERVQEELAARTDLLDCRTHPRTWDLLRLTRMPAVRVELGYLSHEADARRLASPVFQDDCRAVVERGGVVGDALGTPASHARHRVGAAAGRSQTGAGP